MKTNSLLFVALLFFFARCDSGGGGILSPKNGDEFLEYEYYNPGTPTLTSTSPIDKSSDVSVGQASVVEDISANDVIITIDGIRVQTDKSNYEIIKFYVDEDDGGGYKTQSEFGSTDNSIKTDIASVLVLDMSTSLQNIITDLKEYAKTFANTVVSSSSNSKVAVVFFSSRNAIQITNFYDATNINQLNQQIDDFTNYQSKTALFEATNQAINIIKNLSFDGEKSLVVFTDGGDNDSNNPDTQKQEIENSSVNIFTIGLQGSDFDEDDIKDIASKNSQYEVAENESDLDGLFKLITKGVVSVYTLQYKRSNQQLNENEQIKIRIGMDTQKIE